MTATLNELGTWCYVWAESVLSGLTRQFLCLFSSLGNPKVFTDTQDLFVQRECHHLICRSVIQRGNSCCGNIMPGIFWILCFQSRVFPHNISRYQTRQTFPCLVGLRLRQTTLEFAPPVCESEPVCVFTVVRHWQTSFLRSRTTWTVAVYPSVYLSIFLSIYLSVFTCVSVTLSPLATLLTTCCDHLSPLGGCGEL